MLVQQVDGPDVPPARDKALHRDILLEAGYVTRAEMGSPEDILSNPYVSGSLYRPVFLADLRGELARLGGRVTREFPRRHRVEHRVDAMKQVVLTYFEHIELLETFPQQVACWLFGTGVTTMLLLAAGLRNLTVRRRYAESRDLLEAHGRLDFHEEMLSSLGCAELSSERVLGHLDALGEAYDATSPPPRGPFFGSSSQNPLVDPDEVL